MKYFLMIEQRQFGDMGFRGLMGSETAFKNYYGSVPAQALEMVQGTDFIGAPPPESCLWVMPREELNLVLVARDDRSAPVTPWS